MLPIFKWDTRLVSTASGSVINHLSDLAASMNLSMILLLFGAFGQMEQLTGS